MFAVLTMLLVRSGREGGGGGGSGCSVSVGVDDDGLLDDTRDTEEPINNIAHKHCHSMWSVSVLRILPIGNYLDQLSYL